MDEQAGGSRCADTSGTVELIMLPTRGGDASFFARNESLVTQVSGICLLTNLCASGTACTIELQPLAASAATTIPNPVVSARFFFKRTLHIKATRNRG